MRSSGRSRNAHSKAASRPHEFYSSESVGSCELIPAFLNTQLSVSRLCYREFLDVDFVIWFVVVRRRLRRMVVILWRRRLGRMMMLRIGGSLMSSTIAPKEYRQPNDYAKHRGCPNCYSCYCTA